MDPDKILQLLQEAAINPYLAQKVQAYGGAAGLLQQLNTYQGQQNSVGSNAFSNAQGASSARTNVIPLMQDGPLAGVANFGINMFAEPLAQKGIKDAGRVSRPLSFTPINMYDVVRAKEIQAKVGESSSFGREIDNKRSESFLGSMQGMTGVNLGEGFGKTIGTIMSDMALGWAQGGSFSNLNNMVARGAQLENFGGVSSSQVNDLSTIIEQAGFRKIMKDKDGVDVTTSGINTGFTRGTGINAIGAGINELQMRGLFNFGTDAGAGLAADKYRDDPGDLLLNARRQELQKSIKDNTDIMKKPRTDGDGFDESALKASSLKAQEELSSLDAVAGMTGYEKRHVYNTLKEGYRENIMDRKKLSFAAATEEMDTTFSDLSPANISKIKEETNSRLKKTVSSMLELTDALGGIFETLAGNAPELLNKIDQIDDRALTTTGQSDIAKIVRETNYAGKAAGFSPTQIASVMATAAVESRKYGLSFQEGQEIGRQNLLSRGAYRSQDNKGFFGAVSDADYGRANMERMSQAAGSESTKEINRFMAGVETMKATGREVDAQSQEYYDTLKGGDYAEFFRKVGGDAGVLRGTKASQISTDFDAKRYGSENSEQTLNISAEMASIRDDRMVEGAAALAVSITPYAIKQREKGLDVGGFNQLASKFIVREGELDTNKVFSDQTMSAERAVAASEDLSNMLAMDDESYDKYRIGLLKDAGDSPEAQKKAQERLGNIEAMRQMPQNVKDDFITNKKEAGLTFSEKHRKALEYVHGENVNVALELKKTRKSPERARANITSKMAAATAEEVSKAGFTGTINTNLLNMINDPKVGSEDLLGKVLNVVAPDTFESLKEGELTAMKTAAKNVLGSSDLSKESQAVITTGLISNMEYSDLSKEIREKVKKESYDEGKGVFQKTIGKKGQEEISKGKDFITGAYMSSYVSSLEDTTASQRGTMLENYNKKAADPNTGKEYVSKAGKLESVKIAAAMKKALGEENKDASEAELWDMVSKQIGENEGLQEGVKGARDIETKALGNYESLSKLIKEGGSDIKKYSDIRKKGAEMGFSQEQVNAGLNLGDKVTSDALIKLDVERRGEPSKEVSDATAGRPGGTSRQGFNLTGSLTLRSKDGGLITELEGVTATPTPT